MADFFDYLYWRGDISTSSKKINEIDIALFTQLILIPYYKYIEMPKYKTNESILLSELDSKLNNYYTELAKTIGLILPSKLINLLQAMSKTKRFQNIKISNYVSDINDLKETQFTAMTIYDNDTYYVVFSGTDDSLVGWKENLNLICDTPTSGQIEATKYLEYISSFASKIRVLGHSKGGNLALYSLIKSSEETFSKIEKVYNFDGPGLTSEINEREIFKLRKAILYSADTGIVGHLFNHYEKEVVIKSIHLGLYQHDLFSWEIEVDKFTRLDCRSKDGIHIEKKVNNILDTLNDEDRYEFVSALYKMLVLTNSKTLLELKDKKTQVIKNYFLQTRGQRKIMNVIFRDLMLDRVVFRNVFYLVKDSIIVNREERKAIAQITKNDNIN